MRTFLLVLGSSLALGGVTWWWTAGANRGWTKTSVAEERVDEITGIPYREYREAFIPGVEIAAGSVVAGLVIAGVGMLRRPR